MPEGEAYMLRPVDAGMCSYESLLDGTLRLHDIARMNDYLDMKAENQARYEEALAARNRNG